MFNFSQRPSDRHPVTHKTLVTTPKELLDYWGIPHLDQYDLKKPTWTGRRLNGWEQCDLGWSIHEVSHFILATPRFRWKVNYGLGPDPTQSSECRQDKAIDPVVDQDIEDIVVNHDIILFLYHEAPIEMIKHHFNHYFGSRPHEESWERAYSRTLGMIRAKVPSSAIAEVMHLYQNYHYSIYLP